jgi:hypothetical protein
LVLIFHDGNPQAGGEVEHQDEPVTIDVLHTIDKLLETEWRRTEDPGLWLRMAEMGAWIIDGSAQA